MGRRRLREDRLVGVLRRQLGAAGRGEAGGKVEVPALEEVEDELGDGEIGVVRRLGDLGQRADAVDRAEDDPLRLAEGLDRDRRDDGRDVAHRDDPFLEPLPLVVPAEPFHHDPRHVDGDRDHRALGDLAVDEVEGPFRPEEDVVDRLAGLDADQLDEVLLGDRSDHHEDLPQEDLRLLLDLHRLGQLLLGDVAVGDEEVAQVLALDRRGGGDDPPVLEVDPLLSRAAPNGQRTCLLPHGEPLEQLRQLHRPEVPGDGHPYGILRGQRRSGGLPERAVARPVPEGGAPAYSAGGL